jgi:hypothetical protein
MAVRRLVGVDRDRSFHQSLYEFTDRVEGAKYKLGLKKLITKQTLAKSTKDGFKEGKKC